MNAIIALCHFCDLHGPRTLLCTQAFKYSELCEATASAAGNTIVNITENQSHSIDAAAAFARSSSSPPPPQPPITPEHKKPASAAVSATSAAASSQSCKACRAFDKNFHHYISYEPDGSSGDTGDSSLLASTAAASSFSSLNRHHYNQHQDREQLNNNKLCYISQSAPSDSEVFSLVRKATLRTIRYEVFEDPIYFDVDNVASVIGYEFHIKDSKSRGHQRSYSILIIMRDRIYLQHLWSFLSKQMAQIAAQIKGEANECYERETGIDMTVGLLSASSSASSPLFIQNAASQQQRQQQQLAEIARRRGIDYATAGDHHHHQLRSLTELTNDELIYAKLHMWFTWILRMSTCKISEEFVHGPLSEDLQVRIEREQLMNANLAASAAEDDGHDGHDNNEKQQHIIGDEYKSTIEANENDEESRLGPNELLLRNFRFCTLRELLDFVGLDVFHRMAYHTIVGNQVIVRGAHENMIASIVEQLEVCVCLLIDL
jgi:folliculin